MAIEELTKEIISATQKGFFRQKPIFVVHARASVNELNAIEEQAKVVLPKELRYWLLTAGYGDIAEVLSFRREWLTMISSGQLAGSMMFAQDILGNFYAFDPLALDIYCLSRSESVFARISESFSTFMEELVRRNYKLIDWVDALKPCKYDWDG